MKIVGVIPARMGSSRFPGKPLALIRGRPMIEHVYKRSRLCKALDVLAVATPDDEIAEVVRGFRGEVVMTSPRHERATDRVAEAARVLGGDVVQRLMNARQVDPLAGGEQRLAVGWSTW